MNTSSKELKNNTVLGNVVLITGASMGIGAGIARAFRDAGADLRARPRAARAGSSGVPPRSENRLRVERTARVR